jgi:hypothetical protein
MEVIVRIAGAKSTGTSIAFPSVAIRGITMHANTTELFAEIMRANTDLNPAQIVMRYRAITGCGLNGHPLPCVTMDEMFQAVVAADVAAEADLLSQLTSE